MIFQMIARRAFTTFISSTTSIPLATTSSTGNTSNTPICFEMAGWGIGVDSLESQSGYQDQQEEKKQGAFH
jgi:hypothetical protein